MLAVATNRFIGGLWLRFPTDPLMSLFVLPLSFALCPTLGRGCWSGPHCCAGGGGLFLPIVQCTRFVKNVNNRLLLRTDQWERPLPTGNSDRVFRLLYL